MPGTAIVGLQWGDEAKGKIVDILTEQNDIVVRYQGGANAGHTVVFDGKKYKLSLIPSGIFRRHTPCLITGGVVLDPVAILKEIETLRSVNIDVSTNLMISDRVHVIFPWHRIEDRMGDSAGSGEAIGTTMRGIGPCYQDKVGRSLAIRLGDFYKSDFREKIHHVVKSKNRLFSSLKASGDKCLNLSDMDIELDANKIADQYSELGEKLRPFVADTTHFLLDAVDADKRILFEGAQGSLLDIDHGTFPYVTSSNSSGVGICAGSGVPACFIKKVVGILKAYSTRVGGGPFPTEQDNEIGQLIRDRGNEYGTVTLRPRRCGWFDAVAARYTARLGGIDVLSLMLLDVLSGFETLQICTAYQLDDNKINYFPSHIDDIRRVVPIYETVPGWTEDISTISKFEQLPVNARNYVKRISEVIGKPVGIVSVGPDRKQTIIL
ncbi:MAG: adenylosuccinate synthase [Thermoguttaceae bacterium]